MPRKLFTADEVTAAFGQVRKAMESNSELSCAVLGAAYVEKFLGALLRKFFIESVKDVKKLFGSEGVLENCGAQNDIAFILGLISEEAHKNIALISSIRNDFAHSLEELSFQTPLVRGKCSHLTFFHSSPEEKAQFLKPLRTDPKGHFTRCVAITGSYLECATNLTTRRKPSLIVNRAIEKCMQIIGSVAL